MTAAEHHYRPTCLPPMVRSRFPHRATCSCSWISPRGSSSGGLAMAAWEAHVRDEREAPQVSPTTSAYIERLHAAATAYGSAERTREAHEVRRGGVLIPDANEHYIAADRTAAAKRAELVEIAEAFLDEWGGRQGEATLIDVVDTLAGDAIGFAAWRLSWNQWRLASADDGWTEGVGLSLKRLLDAARDTAPRP